MTYPQGEKGSSASLNERHQLWTASRCSRLLRPLEAKLIVLRKSGGRDRLLETEGEGPHPVTETTPAGNDLSWHTRTPKKLYTTRRTPVTLDTSHSGGTGTPGNSRVDVNLPTPFLARVRAQAAASHEVTQAKKLSKPAWTKVRMNGPNKRKRPGPFAAPDALDSAVTAFKTFLEHTKEPAKNPSDTRSLLRLCLTALPAAIEDERIARKTRDKDDKSDVAGETYAWLEDFAQTSTDRTDCLRRAVRSHGIALFREAIADGLIDDLSVAGIINVHDDKRRDVERMITSALVVSNAAQSTVSIVRPDRSSGYHGRVYHHARVFTMPGMVQEQGVSLWSGASSLLLSKCVPASSLPSPTMEDLRSRALRSMIVEPSSAEAVAASNFLTTTLLCAAGVDPDEDDRLGCSSQKRRRSGSKFIELQAPTCRPASEGPHAELLESAANAIKEQCTALLAIGCIDEAQRDTIFPTTLEPVLRVLRDATLGILRNCSSQDFVDLAIHAGLASTTSTIIMADVLATLVNSNFKAAQATTRERVKLIAYLTERRRAGTSVTQSSTDHLSSLIRDTAICCERAAQNAGFHFLKRATDKLTADEWYGGVEARVTRQIALDAALMFAHSTRKNEHLAHARQLESLINSSGRAGHALDRMKDANKQQTQSGVRWEEGLCEWVWATPGRPSQTIEESPATSPAVQASPLKRLRPRTRPRPRIARIDPTVIRSKPKRPFTPLESDNNDELGGSDSSDDQIDRSRPCKKHTLKYVAVRRAPGHDADDEDEDELSLGEAPPLKDVTNLHKTALRAKAANVADCAQG